MTQKHLKLQTLPAGELKYWLEERCVSQDILESLGIAWTLHAQNKWVTIPILDTEGKPLFYKLKRPSKGKESQPKNLVYPKGSTATLYPLPYLAAATNVILCEGEPDALVLIGNGIEAICSTGGAGTFKEEWLELFPKGIKVTICFDLDDAGKKGADKTMRLFEKKRPDIELFRIELPELLGVGGDITDFARYCKKESKDFKTELLSLAKKAPQTDAKKKDENDNRPRVALLTAPKQPVEINEWRSVIRENFQELVVASEIALSTVAQLLIKDITNPFALVLIDVPAAGKTITINFFAESGLPELMYPSDKFSPASFVSNAANVKREDLEKVDLLPRLKYRMFCIRDLATVFSAREEDLISNVGILTRVLDGEGLATDGGVHGQRTRTGDYLFMLLAASTPIPRRVWKVMGNQGPRLFFLGLHMKTKTNEELVRQLQGNACKEKELLCRKVTGDLLRTLWAKHRDGIVWDKTKDQPNHLMIIARCASLLAKLRGTLNTDRERNDAGEDLVYHSPVIEKPDRLNQLLYNLARGHAVALGREYITDEDMPCVALLACDSAPGHRAELLHALIQRGGRVATGQVEKFLKVSKPTALHEMDNLKILGICEEWDPDDITTEKGIKFQEEFMWFCSEECRSHLQWNTGSDLLNSSIE